MRSTFRIIAATVAAVIASTSCTSQNQGTTPAASPAPVDAAPSSDSPEADKNVEYVDLDRTKVSITSACPEGEKREPFRKKSAAVKTFGADAVMDAYCEIAGLYLDDVAMLFPPRDTWNRADFAVFDDRIATPFREEYEREVTEFLDDPQDAPGLLGPTNVDVSVLDIHFRDNNVERVGHRIGAATDTGVRTVDGDKRLDLFFPVYNNYVVYKRNDDTKYLLGVPMDVSIALSRNPDPLASDDLDWLVTGYRHKWQGTGPVTVDHFLDNPGSLSKVDTKKSKNKKNDG